MGRDRIRFSVLAVAIAACTPSRDAPPPPVSEPAPAASPAEAASPRWRTDLDAAMDELLGLPSCTTTHTKAVAELLGNGGPFVACADAMDSIRDELDRISSYRKELVPLDDPAWGRADLQTVASACAPGIAMVEELAAAEERCIDDAGALPDLASRPWGAFNRAIGLTARLQMRRGDAAASFRTIVAGLLLMQKGCRGRGLACESMAGVTYGGLGADLEWLLHMGAPTVDALEALDTGLADLQRNEPTPFELLRVEMRQLVEDFAPKIANRGDAHATRVVENTLVPMLRMVAAEPACRARDRFDECRRAWWGDATAQPPPDEAPDPWETIVGVLEGKSPELVFELVVSGTHKVPAGADAGLRANRRRSSAREAREARARGGQMPRRDRVRGVACVRPRDPVHGATRREGLPPCTSVMDENASHERGRGVVHLLPAPTVEVPGPLTTRDRAFMLSRTTMVCIVLTLDTFAGGLGATAGSDACAVVGT